MYWGDSVPLLVVLYSHVLVHVQCRTAASSRGTMCWWLLPVISPLAVPVITGFWHLPHTKIDKGWSLQTSLLAVLYRMIDRWNAAGWSRTILLSRTEANWIFLYLRVMSEKWVEGFRIKSENPMLVDPSWTWRHRKFPTPRHPKSDYLRVSNGVFEDPETMLYLWSEVILVFPFGCPSSVQMSRIFRLRYDAVLRESDWLW